MKPIFWTLLGELAREVVSALRQKRQREKALKQREKLRKARERARIKAHTAERIRQAKEKYWTDRRRREAEKKLLQDHKADLDSNPYWDKPEGEENLLEDFRRGAGILKERKK